MPWPNVSVEEALSRAREAGVLEEMEELGVRYMRWNDACAGLERGTLVLGGRLIPAFPHIPRITRVIPGIQRNLRGPFWVEEKIDGYNVRLVWHDGRILAFTRGGYLCPFSTDRAPDFIPSDWFDQHSDLVLVAEYAGPENPYIEAHPPWIQEDVGVFVFAVWDREGPWSPSRRYAVLKEAGIPQPEHWGPYRPEEADAVISLLRTLDQRGVEGVVIKEDRAGGMVVKYHTPASAIYDIGVDSALLLELPPEFFVQRLQRLGVALRDLGLPVEETLYCRVGRALLEGYLTLMEQVEKENRPVAFRFSIQVNDPSVGADLLTLFRRVSSTVRVRYLGKASLPGGKTRMYFEKVFQKATAHLRDLLGGTTLVD